MRKISITCLLLKTIVFTEINESERRLAEIEGEELDISPADLLDFSGLDLSIVSL